MPPKRRDQTDKNKEVDNMPELEEPPADEELQEVSVQNMVDHIEGHPHGHTIAKDNAEPQDEILEKNVVDMEEASKMMAEGILAYVKAVVSHTTQSSSQGSFQQKGVEQDAMNETPDNSWRLQPKREPRNSNIAPQDQKQSVATGSQQGDESAVLPLAYASWERSSTCTTKRTIGQQLRVPPLANHSLQKLYKMEELLERSPTLPQTYQKMAGNDGKSPEKLTVNSTRVRRTELVKKFTDKTRRRITTQRLVAASKANDWSSNPKAGLSNTQKQPDVASKRCVPTYINDVAQTQQQVANPSSGFLSANQKRRRTTYVIQTLALAQNNQTQATQVANPSSGFLSANQKRRRTTYVIQTLALAQNNQTQATVELTIIDICSQLDNQTIHMRTNLSQLVPDATPQNDVVSNLSKRYRFALNKQDKAAAGYKHSTRLH
ncbi:hypothetical protein F511_17014 [Dorcoceras hygrometricum]|uniref:Uncharacterized protein n=1 Tax=Dorcoceras hygrometricum TaxID=472368 RepID=A0A2Z7BZA8_9LAMI|nr:hypothetical protein F511_17014 [Dorcoceras hygrometricum]